MHASADGRTVVVEVVDLGEATEVGKAALIEVVEPIGLA